MIVYGDHKRTQDAQQLREAAGEMAIRLDRMSHGIRRHAALVGLFISVSELVQALADVDFGTGGIDIFSPRQQQGARLLVGLAAEVAKSWRSGFNVGGGIDPGLLKLLAGLDCQAEVLTGSAEGYAHYALYPESYLDAAQKSGLDANTCVIGVRSIGLGLAAMVAASIGAPAPFSVRPIGHPFHRHINADPRSITAWKNNPSARFAVVDEGPGLSGSSMHAVVVWLRELDVDTDRIHLFPSHSGGPGSEASPEARETWSRCPKHVATAFESTFSESSKIPTLRDWVAEAVGRPELNLTELSGGEWRAAHYADEGRWPPSPRGTERRKFLASAGRDRWLVKFAGLGETGLRKKRAAAMLHEAGFGSQVVALCHGFLVERWIDGSTMDQAPLPREKLIAELTNYLTWRALNLRTCEPGASLLALAEMAVSNASEALGEKRAATLRGWLSKPTSAHVLQRVEIDGKLQPWEFLVRADGTVLKTDAVDHCRAHDLIGCQPIEWDIAGARVEYGLSDSDVRTLVEGMELAIDRDHIGFFEPCYLAFQLGLWSTAAQSENGGEKTRLAEMADRYRMPLIRFLDECRI
ncbi:MULTISPECIES: hypothetical protein [Mesorhizobium]|uniref:Uncharacterized protein n=1 Tax=Mesorhizobium ciceri TaxID=39645 RepID=A0AB38T9Z0_9HYPH|nr:MULTISPECIES: hypothetical protein [Mesorhizobium]MDF3214250.1 hypothetical protein [Mesorhizobium ciceri]RUZ10045.1 hypothetical protein EN955_02530 [Mesorhizobium sp. M7A.F.Ca.CA.001.04.2.1]RUZ26262.1 hypothetical protein EN961_01665 [Mesorhizobium sp. M7A.F.Ca.CA.001.09.1.1]RUZ42805.1 hypothetical protein EN952_02735 [Mesorhizobium sp. M7A.F.Ca.CA.001.15.1.1]RVA66439.1 hypothetical protein EN913_14600 [Mesorhizobium sp. M7A.F.Ca.CA.001.08.1.1]